MDVVGVGSRWMVGEVFQDVACGDDRVVLAVVVVGAIAAPGVFFGLGDEFGAYGVQMDIFAHLDFIDEVHDQFFAESTLEKMAAPFVFSVDVYGVFGVDIMHDFAYVCVGGFDLEMGVVGHEAVGVKVEVKFLFGLLDGIEVHEIIVHVHENIALAVPPGGDVVLRSLVPQSLFSRHLCEIFLSVLGILC
ncbi:hypothetical protein JOC95_000452 [Bacillus tianshenii]|uniref:Uncharacterized protein n=1 Tax=Sutcliffiella tianshenii TaxID=1463404 RepID=A0ABS2NVB8_9BACI|nr:hypothetical protein [Bacillus tianshenii]